MKLFRLTVILTLGLQLAACNIQLNGPIGGATVTISELRNPDAILGTALSSDVSDWSSNDWWADLAPQFQLLFIGSVTLVPDGIDPAALYLVTANGGVDYDPERSAALSDTPRNIQSQWRSIMTGRQIIDRRLKVSALTEAIYQQVAEELDNYSDAEILLRLDAAARLLVSDLDDSGTVDYADVLRFSRTTDGNSFQTNLAALDQMATSLYVNQTEPARRTLAEFVYGNYVVRLATNFGDIDFTLFNYAAPISVANFLDYVEAGFYDDSIFHRLDLGNEVLQGGFLEVLGDDVCNDAAIKDGVRDPILNEASNGLRNIRSTVGMARTSDPNSATAQFYINLGNNPGFDFGSSSNPDGFAVFAEVSAGMDVVDAMAQVQTGFCRGLNDFPAEFLLIETAALLP